MINLKSSHLRINKAPSLMGAWGLLILFGSIMQQYFEIRMDYVLIMWGLLTLLGVAAQAVCLVRGLGTNFAAWIGVIVVGWFLTLYIIKLDSGYNMADYVGDLPGIWLGLMGVGYALTSFHVVKKFWILAGVSFLFAAIMELEARQIVEIDFLGENSTILFGIFAGLPLIIASLPYFYRPEPKAVPAPNTTVPTTG